MYGSQCHDRMRCGGVELHGPQVNIFWKAAASSVSRMATVLVHTSLPDCEVWHRRLWEGVSMVLLLEGLARRPLNKVLQLLIQLGCVTLCHGCGGRREVIIGD